ncbi:PREDICTED: uncharacterized protein LOC102016891 [Chinchilla lanigera]|uniref:uncharacterized protein LOC102016891 n=1 Tax=Chinchilla lanigera TaxID=34839 RepID=UPI000697BFC8|nr:PREDICTED: uncharacterized protein LOC102016891 [Chinchilla lanigera]
MDSPVENELPFSVEGTALRVDSRSSPKVTGQEESGPVCSVLLGLSGQHSFLQVVDQILFRDGTLQATITQGTAGGFPTVSLYGQKGVRKTRVRLRGLACFSSIAAISCVHRHGENRDTTIDRSARRQSAGWRWPPPFAARCARRAARLGAHGIFHRAARLRRRESPWPGERGRGPRVAAEMRLAGQSSSVGSASKPGSVGLEKMSEPLDYAAVPLPLHVPGGCRPTSVLEPMFHTPPRSAERSSGFLLGSCTTLISQPWTMLTQKFPGYSLPPSLGLWFVVALALPVSTILFPGPHTGETE